MRELGESRSSLAGRGGELTRCSARTRSSSSLPPPVGYQPPSLFPKSGARSTATKDSDSSDGRVRTTVAKGHRVLTKRRPSAKPTSSAPRPLRISRRKGSFGIGEDREYVADVSDMSDTNPYAYSQGRPWDVSSRSFLAPPPRSRRHSSASPSPPSSPDLSPSPSSIVVDRSATRGARGAIIPPLPSQQSLYDSLQGVFDAGGGTSGPELSDDSTTSRRSRATSSGPHLPHRDIIPESQRPPSPSIAPRPPPKTYTELPQLTLTTSIPYRPSLLASTPLNMSPATPASATAPAPHQVLHHPTFIPPFNPAHLPSSFSPPPPPFSPPSSPPLSSLSTPHSSADFYSADSHPSPTSPRRGSFSTILPPRAKGRTISLEQREALEAVARFPHPYEQGMPWMQEAIDSQGSLPLVEIGGGGLTVRRSLSLSRFVRRELISWGWQLTNPDDTTGSSSVNPSRRSSVSDTGHEGSSG